MQLEVSFRQVAGTGAAMGWAGTKTVIADRRAGSAGGLGLGLSGGELLALSLGAGYFNQLHFSAAELGIEIADAEVDVRVAFEGDPLLVAAAELCVRLNVAGDATDKERLLAHAGSESTISNAVVRGFPVSIAAS